MKPYHNNGISTTNLNWWVYRISEPSTVSPEKHLKIQNWSHITFSPQKACRIPWLAKWSPFLKISSEFLDVSSTLGRNCLIDFCRESLSYVYITVDVVTDIAAMCRSLIFWGITISTNAIWRNCVGLIQPPDVTNLSRLVNWPFQFRTFRWSKVAVQLQGCFFPLEMCFPKTTQAGNTYIRGAKWMGGKGC